MAGRRVALYRLGGLNGFGSDVVEGRRGIRRLSENLMDDPAVDIGKTEIATSVAEGEPLVI